jgi:phosphatidylethanolamine/phosphatidyl-N-methylethanolamine N-methyltransferase
MGQDKRAKHVLQAKTAIRRSAPLAVRFRDEARFLRNWFENPLLTGAVIPSGRYLARAMATFVDPRRSGPVIELGPGTGPVTEALLRRGIVQERLILIEYSPDFCQLLKRRYPKACIVQGDAYDMATTLRSVLDQPAIATLSSLPLLTRPPAERVTVMQQAHNLMQNDAPFIQFTYGVTPPIPERGSGYKAEGSDRIWRNLPPARVWAYRRCMDL